MPSKPMKFKEGQKVHWTSSSSGSTTTKEGKVVKVVAAFEHPDGFFRDKKQTHSSNFGYGFSRNEESYIIEVPGKTKTSKPKLYWPVTSLLRKGPAPRSS